MGVNTALETHMKTGSGRICGRGQAPGRLQFSARDGAAALWPEHQPTARPSFRHNFGRMPVQPKTGMSRRDVPCDPEAGQRAGRVSRMPELPAGPERGSRLRGSQMPSQPLPHHSTDAAAPPIVHQVLRSPGQPLDGGTRAFMEPRFDHDFSGVRVHIGEAAAESARSVQAMAYTVGQQIVFGAGLFAPQTPDGQRLLAHELAHVVQQSSGHAAPASINPLPAGSGAWQVLQRQPAPGTTAIRTVTPRGRNPAACMAPLCNQIAQPPTPRTDQELRQRVQNWLSASLDCVRNGAAASNASHFAEIQDNNVSELQAYADEFLQNFERMSTAERARYRSQALGWLQADCRRLEREAQIEFHYNVVFENPPGGLPWGYSPAEWGGIEDALAALPAEATWLNPTLLHFRREACHPSQVNQIGQCGLLPGGGSVGGETSMSGGTAQITVFNTGLSQSPMARSASLGLAATAQVFRHEVGHVIASKIPQADRDDLFENIVGWHDFPWDWITVRSAPHPNWQAERVRLRTQLGLNDTQFDAWLAALTLDVPAIVGPHTYIKRAHTLGGSSYYVQSYVTSRVPGGVEFEYARTSQAEYLAELYALAASRPQFLHAVLPANQLAWWKRVVFHTPEHIDGLARQAAVSDPALTEFLVRSRQLFTREQLSDLLNEVLTRRPQPSGQAIA